MVLGHFHERVDEDKNFTMSRSPVTFLVSEIQPVEQKVPVQFFSNGKCLLLLNGHFGTNLVRQL